MKASDFIATYGHLGQTAWENAAVADASKSFADGAWNFVELTVPGPGGSSATFYVTDDAFSIGEGSERMRLPLSPLAAQRIADRLGLVLLTPRMVDLADKVATRRIAPITMNPPGPGTETLAKWLRHSQAVDQALFALGGEGRGLVSGAKKDIVLTNALATHPGNVAIYGWRKLDGSVIQGLNASDHDNRYADYSHGARFALRNASFTDASGPRSIDLLNVLRNPELASLLSHEGPLRVLAYPTAAATPSPPVLPASYAPPSSPPPSASVAPPSKSSGPWPWVLAGGVLGALLRRKNR